MNTIVTMTNNPLKNGKRFYLRIYIKPLRSPSTNVFFVFGLKAERVGSRCEIIYYNLCMVIHYSKKASFLFSRIVTHTMFFLCIINGQGRKVN